MTGILSFGAYIPKNRLNRDVIAKAWGATSMGGEKAIANFDEDTITMAVEAGFDCISGFDSKEIDGCYFASTTAPYREKQSSSLIATVLDLRRDIATADFSNSLRAGANALKAGIDAINSKSASKVLVLIADARLGAPESEFEQSLGDGAAAFLLGDSGVSAAITGRHSVCDESAEYWRTDHDAFIRSWEARFASTIYSSMVEELVSGILRKYSLAPAYFSKLVLYASNPRQHAEIARKLGFDIKRQLADLLFYKVGNTGAALAPMMLVGALEQAKPGDKILLVSYGDGCDGFIINVTGEIEKLRGRRGIKVHLDAKASLGNYEKYLRFKGLVTRDAVVNPGRPSGPSSLPLLSRDKASFLSFHGSRCKSCSLVEHPVQRVCSGCRSKDNFEEVRLAKKGTIFTYSENYLADVPDPPQIEAVVLLEDGARVYVRLTESESQDPLERPKKIGMPVEMTFRKISSRSGFYNYYWKARPIRGGGAGDGNFK